MGVRAPESLQAVPYDRSQVTVGIVHFGVGNFHRSHQAMFIDRLLRLNQAQEWGICGVGVLPSDAGMRDALRSQDLEYTLVERHADGTTPAQRIGSIVEYLFAPEELEQVLERLAAPTTRIVSLTVTEGGYNISDATGAFDTANPSMIKDAENRDSPETVFGIICAGLDRRRRRGLQPFTVMSCDNIQGNGEIARGCFIAFAGMYDANLATWIADNVAFPNSMVDRITPVTTDADRAYVQEAFGTADAWPVISEPFVQWVLEDHFTLGRPAFEEVGVQVVSDVRPYELMKLRLLNASHQAMAYFGMLAGYTYAHEAASDPTIVALLRRYMDDEATETLEPVPGVDIAAYKRELIERFANPFVRDTLLRLSTDASDRIPKFIVPVARERAAKGDESPLVAAVIASWAVFAQRALTGEFVLQDRRTDLVSRAVQRQQADRVGYLRDADWFGELAREPGFADDFAHAFDLISTRDADSALSSLLGPTSDS